MATNHQPIPCDWKPASAARHPAVLAALCVATGVAIGDAGDLESTPTLIVAMTSAVASLLLLRSSLVRPRLFGSLLLALALVGFGAWRISIDNDGRPSESLAELMTSNRQVEIFARVSGTPYQKTSGWRVPLDHLAIQAPVGNVTVSGKVLLTSIPSLQGLRYGDYIRFKGRVYAPSVQRNPGGFDYAEYLHRQGYDATVRPESGLTQWPQDNTWSVLNAVEPIRVWIRKTFAEFLDTPSQALLVGLLLGDTDRLPKPIYDAFRESGTSHLLAVSGANVWLVVGMLLLPMYWLAVPRWPRTIIAVLSILVFSFLTRNEPSVVRASLMVSLILVGQLFWRPVAPMNAVGAAALIIMTIAPAHLFRPGFQLSFAAVIAILVAVSRVDRHLTGAWRSKLAYVTVMFLVASIAATVGTAPICAWHFGTVPIAGVISNILMVPLAGLTAHAGLLLLPIQAMSATAGTWLAWLTAQLLTLSTWIAHYFANFSWAVLSWPSPSVFTLAHVLLGVLLCLMWNRRYQWFRPLIYYVCLLLASTAAYRLLVPSNNPPSIALLDSGGQRTMVVSPAGEDAVGVIDDPGLEDEIDQWVVQPFLRHHIGRPTLSQWTPWRRLEQSRPTHKSANTAMAPIWRRIYTQSGSDSMSLPRPWVDHWSFVDSEVLMFRDKPPFDHTSIATQQSRSGQEKLLVIPATGEKQWIQQVIEWYNPAAVILYGRPYRPGEPGATLAFWKLRHPDRLFYTSAVNGCLRLALEPDGVTVIPTISSAS